MRRAGNTVPDTDTDTDTDASCSAKTVSESQRQQALQSAIFNSSTFSSIATDECGVIQIFNVGAERMLGYSAAEVLNRITPADLSDPQELVTRAQALSEELATPIAPGFEALVYKARRGIEDVSELTYLRKDGSRLPAVVSVTALRDTADTVIGYLLIGTDNTLGKQAQAERIRLDTVLKDKLLELKNAMAVAEVASLAKSSFLSSMSHELRSPLNAILGFAQLMELGQPAPTSTQKASIDQILQAGWYLLDLINEVLDLALIESGKLSLSLEPLELVELLADCEAMIKPQADKSGIKVDFHTLIPPSLVCADATRFKQVLINLLSNAIKYNIAGGRVDVHCSVAGSDRIRISVHDSGEGLAPDKLEQLFESFNRLGQESGAQQGTGIGLVVCKRLVEIMGGTIGVDSTVGQGSVFWFELDRAHKTLSAMEAAAPSSRPAALSEDKSRTVLYVEDNLANLLLMEQLLARRPDVCMLSARDGHQGVEVARARQPEVIVMDINLPGISGLTALQILADDALTAHIPVVALSANAMPRDIEKGLLAGFFHYLTKPIKVDEFMETLDRALAAAKRNSERRLP